MNQPATPAPVLAIAPPPDVFTGVHKGLRKALFDLTLALGRAEPDPGRSRAERALGHEVIRFLRRHGDNEDALLLPLLKDRASEVFTRLTAAHAEIDAAIDALERALDTTASPALYLEAARFTARYLEHMGLEELELEPAIRAVLTADELLAFGAQSVARTPEAQRPSMIAFVLAALPAAQRDAMRARLPATALAAIDAVLRERTT